MWRISFVGTENIPNQDGRGLIVAGNHQTYLDPVWVSIPLKMQVRYLAWDMAFRWPVLGSLMRYLGAVPVNTRSGRSTESWREARMALAQGAAVMIFPEGAREFGDGAPMPFKSGAARLAIESGVPILPFAVRGANRVWAQGMKYPRRGTVEIEFLPVLEFGPCPEGVDRRAFVRICSEKLESTIVSKMDF